MGAKKSIARIDNNEYLEPNNKEMFINMGIDYLFYPEKVAAREVINLLGHSATTEYVDFSGGKLSLVVFRLEPNSSLVGRSLDGFSEEEMLDYRTVAISRDGDTIIPRGGETFMVGDMVYIIARQDAAGEVMALSGKGNVRIKNMMILGGSRIGVRIATELQNDVNIKLIDYNADKAYRLAETLDKTLIINEDGRNTEAMMEEGLSNMDAFVAVTGRSETNILTAMLAKRMGVKKVIAEVENLNYINLADSVGVDTIINKKMITASNIFRFTMSTDVLAIKCLTGSDAEVLEFAGDEKHRPRDGTARGCHRRRHRPRRQGVHRVGQHANQRLRPGGGVRHAVGYRQGGRLLQLKPRFIRNNNNTKPLIMYIAIAGNIGSGKTTLTEILTERYGAKAYYEDVDNPYINDFYEDMNRWAFQLQVYFLGSRIQQTMNMLSDGSEHIFQDRTIYEDAHIFAGNLHQMGLMSSRDFGTYMKLFDISSNLIPKPDLLIYLKASVPTLVSQIRRRGRDYEQNIDSEYLQRLNDKYNDWIDNGYDGEIFVIDKDKDDFVENESVLAGLYERLEQIRLSQKK